MRHPAYLKRDGAIRDRYFLYNFGSQSEKVWIEDYEELTGFIFIYRNRHSDKCFLTLGRNHDGSLVDSTSMSYSPSRYYSYSGTSHTRSGLFTLPKDPFDSYWANELYDTFFGQGILYGLMSMAVVGFILFIFGWGIVGGLLGWWG